MDGIIIILAHMNDKRGKLSKIAMERLDLGKKVFLKNKDYRILLTGGVGKIFNYAKLPHYVYAQRYLITQGLQKKDFLPGVESSNTVRDALNSKKVVLQSPPKKLIIITSDFHLRRARFIFKKVFKKYKLKFYSSKTILEKDKIKVLRKHEKIALKRLKKLRNFY